MHHPDAGQKKQQGLTQSREVFHLAVAVGVPLVRGFGGNTHGQQGHSCGQEIQAAVQGLGKKAQAVGGQAHGQFEQGKPQRGQQGNHCGFLFFVAF